MKKKVLFDMDGCKVDFVGGIISFLQENYPHATIEPSEINEFYFFDSISCSEAKQAAIEHMHTPGFFQWLEPVDEAMVAYQTLVDLGHDVWICTGPLSGDSEEHSKEDKRIWVLNYLGFEAAEKMIFSFDKTTIEADVIIDDLPHLTKDKTNIRFTDWLIVDQFYNQVLPEETKLYPVGRINNDWSNWREEFAKVGLL